MHNDIYVQHGMSLRSFNVQFLSGAQCKIIQSDSSSCGEGEVMIENILGLVVWIVFGTQHHEPALELINVHGKILQQRKTV